MKSIDFKSLLIGILGTALVMVLMGVIHSKGNYQIACNTEKCHLLNTNTGKVKQLFPIYFKDMPKYMHQMNRNADF